MKKFLSMQLVLVLLLSLLTGCGNNTSGETAKGNESETSAESVSDETTSATENATTKEDTTAEESATESADTTSTDAVSVMALKGPTAMGMVKLMNDADTGVLTSCNYDFSIAASVDEVTPALVQGNADIAAVPANVASVLYNNTKGNIEVLAINTLGVLYIVENGDSVQSVSDLKGKTIYASGKGATPEYALNYILQENGINPETDVTIEWKSEHTECLAALTGTENGIALLPQPFVTTAQTKMPDLRVALDLTQEWDNLQTDDETASALITGVVVARKDFIEQNPDAVADFLTQYEASVDYVNSNISDAAILVGNYGIVDAAVAEKAIPACNITYIDGAEMKTKLSGYLNTLLEQNPESIGGALPADDFYFQQ